jgi:hypothetical protein
MLQVPYFLCPDKETRNAFRRYQADHPDQYDYKAAQIPVEKPLTVEEENAQQAKKQVIRVFKRLNGRNPR